MIRNTFFKIFFMLLIILFALPAISFSESEKDEKYSERFFFDKAQKMEKLSIEEFNILLSKTGNRILAFQKAFSELRIEDGNFDYSTGKLWEIQLKASQESFQKSSQILELVKKDANKISYSLTLYHLMVQMSEEGKDFSQIPAFKTKLVKVYLDLLTWRQAFIKAHLFLLSIAKDKNEKLY